MPRLRICLFTLALLAPLVLTPAAMAVNNDGRGFYGATTDKAVTYFAFGVIILFPLFIFAMSMLQGRLERRKQERKAAQQAQLGDVRWHGGW
jgi:hypothetical protein